ncbi:DUF6090 family protein [Winogradskyella immobilis]|uniref:Uncharacterized protein n=1 Tax=Winogradskyella immobilis TaxID=2816852 RepID=A0ABS8EMV3_9FLAO|nr:DUF6090 family protein [Winogradskyella immobilis]MCC1483905.1 hypothetical protein [Winogradskyella immobilis]MCG0015998.1 hypothetical protein [Winogradskyella immobilis]
MIKFFRHIRKSLLTQGKTGKYFKYAIGEIILVVIGILIALQINNWNENRKLNEQRKELISNLITDFTDTNETLVSAIEKRENELNTMNTFYKIIENETQTISVDSLRKIATVFFMEDNFKPTISSYNEAVSNGDFRLLKSRSLTQYIDRFFESADSYSNTFNFGGENFFNGSAWELRKSLGSLQPIVVSRSNFDAMPYKKLLYSEYISKVNEPLTTATFENSYVIKKNLAGNLKQMKTSCDSIIATLKKLDND